MNMVAEKINNDVLRILLVSGGTGGHVYPAVAIAQAMQARMPNSLIEFVGRENSFESKAIANFNFPFHALKAAPIKGMGPLKILRSIFTILSACISARKIIKDFAPHCVIGTGGYVTGPLMLVAKIMKVPTVIHEQNSVPGLTNRILSRLVDKVCTSFAEATRYFSLRKVVETGMPIRASIVERATAPEFAPPLTLLVMGGSQGARSINQMMMESLANLSAIELPLKVIHQAGAASDLEEIRLAYAKNNIEAEVHVFIDDMPAVYSKVHLAISRAGSGSLAELANFGIPSILIPFPYATDNHQEMNARELVAHGAAVLLRERDSSPRRLGEQLVQILNDAPRLRQMSHAMRELARPLAADEVVNVCLEVIGSNR